MTPVRIACVQYLNTLPLIEGLESLAGVELIRAVPARISDLVRSGRADLGLVSVIDAAEPGLSLIPAGLIGCDGPTLTVRLFSAAPIPEITTVHADCESHTSVALCRIVLDRMHGVRPEVFAFEAAPDAEEKPEDTARRAVPPRTMLLIGDKVVTRALPADQYPHQLDLGEAWHALTGLPFVYAVWMCRAGEEDSPAVRMAAAVLDRQLRRNRARMDWIVANRAGEHGWPRELASRYLGSLLRYGVGEREREAVARFMDEAVRLGLVGPGACVHWAPAGVGA